MKTYSVNGVYGSQSTPCTVFVATEGRGASWYVVEGSVNVNKTWVTIGEGVNVEEIQDFDAFTASEPINSEETLIEQIEL